MLLFFNFGCIWTHAVDGAAEGRTVVLDFVGQCAFLYYRMHEGPDVFSLLKSVYAKSIHAIQNASAPT